MGNRKDTSHVIIHGVTIAEGDIVFIKFRKLEDVLKDQRKLCPISNTMDFYEIDNNMNAFLRGCGHFKVESVSSKDNGDYLRLNPDRDSDRKALKKVGTLSRQQVKQQEKQDLLENNALDEIKIYNHNNDFEWNLNEILIEEIRVDNDHAEAYFSEKHDTSLVLIDSVLFLNGVPITPADSKIFEMFEKVMAEAAINKLFAGQQQEQIKDDEF